MAATYKPDLGSHCKQCKIDLDDGDVYEKLKSIFSGVFNDNEIIRQAHCHGWTQDKPIRFSKELIVYHNREKITVCPKCHQKYPLRS